MWRGEGVVQEVLTFFWTRTWKHIKNKSIDRTQMMLKYCFNEVILPAGSWIPLLDPLGVHRPQAKSHWTDVVRSWGFFRRCDWWVMFVEHYHQMSTKALHPSPVVLSLFSLPPFRFPQFFYYCRHLMNHISFTFIETEVLLQIISC